MCSAGWREAPRPNLKTPGDFPEYSWGSPLHLKPTWLRFSEANSVRILHSAVLDDLFIYLSVPGKFY